ncbi:hypothetical protein SKAU_G00423110 [Synaphobranchus kaupii]|uniref:BAH domain-containing protein n=1 Tax=Synaphobranchus kaupii TaxID=118154 RepID=A0A9Q1IAI1_SYNKA|nr:hypothetical protein SKAU_G00423110 [Synaphobranchus kaupii]
MPRPSCTPPPLPCPAHTTPCPMSHGMELLSELAYLELQYHKRIGRDHAGEEMLTFDLQSLATLAVARALEQGAVDGEGEGEGGGERHGRTLNLRRKCTWTPRHEPVCPVKVAMETMDGQEVAMRVQLAELQRRYKEKQRELAKLQRKHEHTKQERSRSPVRRGPGRPRKRKSPPSAGPGTLTETPKRARSMEAGLGQLMDDLIGGGSIQRKEKTLSNQDYNPHNAQCCKRNGGRESLSSKLAQKVSQQLKQKVKVNGGVAMVGGFHRRAPGALSPSRGLSNTALAGRGAQEGWVGRMLMFRRNRTKALWTGSSAGRKQEVTDTSLTESESSQREEDSSQDSDKEQDSRATYSKDSISLNVIGPSPCSVVKLEANQKAMNKKERQGLQGSLRVPCVEEVKVRRRPDMVTTRQWLLEPEEEKGEGRRRSRRSRQPRRLGVELQVSPATSRRLEKATSKSRVQQRILGKGKGRAVSRLLESFAADEDFLMDEDGSFSEGEEPGHKSRPHRDSPPVMPSCLLSKDQLVDGLKVLISKEDELLYAAYLHTLDLSDIYSVVIEGERGNRPRIYSLEQLLQEAVLDVRPDSEVMLSQGTRVCAYWSERSRCLYPGYVHREGAGEQGKQGSVMVEFDDGDRGWISLHNIRLLPPGYQIRCAEPAPTLLMSVSHRRRRSSTLEKRMPSDRPDDSTARPGVPNSVNSGKSPSAEISAPLLSWPAVDTPRRRAPLSRAPLSRAPRRTLKGKKVELLPLLAPPTAPPLQGLFSSSAFEVDSFSSIAHGYASFAARQALVPLGGGGGRRTGKGGPPRGRGPCGGGGMHPVKLDHEGVTAPKTKSSKALMQQQPGGKTRGGVSMGVSLSVSHAHPVLLIKDIKKGRAGGGAGAELFLNGVSHQHKSPHTLPMGTLAEYHGDCPSGCSGSCSLMEEEEERRRAAMAGRFLSRLSVSSCSSGSSSSSSSSLCCSSLCSSENDSSYSSEEEEGVSLLLQGCLPSHHALLQATEPPPLHRPPAAQRAFVGKIAGGNKPIRRKEGPDSSPSASRRFRLLPGSVPPARQLWKWSGIPTQRRGMKGKARKLFYKAIVRGRDTVRVGDCAVFLSSGRPHLPYVGHIQSLWESWTSSMVVKVKWFYHPEETKLGKRHRDGKHALYQSSHEDENDVQTISHRCQVVSQTEYERLSCGRKPPADAQDLFYLAGTYDPTSGQLLTTEGQAILC